jgi:GTPase SAR1 family protein
LTTHYYRDADAFLLVFGLDNKESFDAIKDYWLPSLDNYAPPGTLIVLVGTYSNSNSAIVSEIDVRSLAEASEAKFVHYLKPGDLDSINKLFTLLAIQLSPR